MDSTMHDEHDDELDDEPKRTHPPSLSHLGQHPITISDESREYLASIPETADSLIEMERLRREYPSVYRGLFEWCTTFKRQKTLLVLAENRLGVTYDLLAEETGFTYDTVRVEVVPALVELDVVERGGKPAIVRYKDDARYILAIDALSFILD